MSETVQFRTSPRTGKTEFLIGDEWYDVLRAENIILSLFKQDERLRRELSAATARAERAEEALREIAGHEVGNPHGACLVFQDIARKALLPSEGSGHKAGAFVRSQEFGQSPRAGQPTVATGSANGPPPNSTPAPEGFSCWLVEAVNSEGDPIGRYLARLIGDDAPCWTWDAHRALRFSKEDAQTEAMRIAQGYRPGPPVACQAVEHGFGDSERPKVDADPRDAALEEAAKVAEQVAREANADGSWEQGVGWGASEVANRVRALKGKRHE